MRGFFVEEVNRKMHALCPICDAKITMLGSTEVSEIISCQDCHNALEVVKIHKDAGSAEVKVAPKVEEDWGE